MIFETLYSYSGVLRRHCQGPLAAERAAFIEALAARGLTRETQLRQCRYCLCVAREVQRRPPGRLFDQGRCARHGRELGSAARCSGSRRDPPPLGSGPVPRHGVQLPAFPGAAPAHSVRCGCRPWRVRCQAGRVRCFAQGAGHWQSEATCRAGRWQIRHFLADLKQHGVALQDLQPCDIDGFFERASQRWGRRSLGSSAKMLRQWLQYAGQRGWCRPRLEDAVEVPRVYRHEDLPLGPSWDTVGRMLAATEGDAPAAVRDRGNPASAVCLRTAVGRGPPAATRRSRLGWEPHPLRALQEPPRGIRPNAPRGRRSHRTIPRQAPARHEPPDRLPHAVPAPTGRWREPTLYSLVVRRYPAGTAPSKGRGPHGLRHACARHLLEAGHSLKEVGDHLGHRSPDSTRTYAKVNLRALREVAFEDLGGLP